MTSQLVIVIITLGFSIVIGYIGRQKNWFANNVGAIGISMMVFVGLAGVGNLLNDRFIKAIKPADFVEATTVPLLSVKTQEDTEGHFLFASGSLGQESYYIFYTANDKGEFQRNKIKDDGRVFTKEENRQDGLLITRTCQFLNPQDNESNARPSSCSIGETQIVLHVPVGSIVRTYSLQ